MLLEFPLLSLGKNISAFVLRESNTNICRKLLTRSVQYPIFWFFWVINSLIFRQFFFLSSKFCRAPQALWLRSVYNPYYQHVVAANVRILPVYSSPAFCVIYLPFKYCNFPLRCQPFSQYRKFCISFLIYTIAMLFNFPLLIWWTS